jgi:hypothetical protein
MLTNLTKDQEEGIVSEEHMEPIMWAKAIVKFKILLNFITRKISLIPMETILIILIELEYLKGLVKLVRRKDVDAHRNQIVIVHPIHAIRRINVNKTHYNKTLHLAVEINQTLIEGLGDTRASMLIMVASVLRELGIMHLMGWTETYKITSGIVTRTWKNYKTSSKSGRDCMLDGFLIG